VRYMIELEDMKPVSLNAERSAHWTKRAAATDHILQRTSWEILDQGIPPFSTLTVEFHIETKGRLMDCGNAYPSMKAMIDALQKMKIIPDDSPKYLTRITMNAPTKAKQDQITMSIQGELA
jgi:hypothetical protein